MKCQRISFTSCSLGRIINSCKVVFQTESAVPCLCLLREEILEDCGASPEAYGSVMYLATRFGKLGRLRASILMQPGMHNKADSISVNVT